MPSEPSIKRAITFIDGQNLYHSVKEAFGYPYPNYDPLKLSEAVCTQHGFHLEQVRFYTGVPKQNDNTFWHEFWRKKIQFMKTRNIHVYTRELVYRNQTVQGSNGQILTTLVGSEKGIDVRIALDIVRLAINKNYDVAIVFSQDQDLNEATDEVAKISIEQGRWIKRMCSFPASPVISNGRGINKTDWFKFDKLFYDQCIDPNNYKPPRTTL